MIRKGIEEFDSEVDYCNIDNLQRAPNDPPTCEKALRSFKSGSRSQLMVASQKQNDSKTLENSGNIRHIRIDKADLKKPHMDSRSDVWNRLNKPKVENEKLHQEFKQFKDEKELAECTFKPSITKQDPQGNLLVSLEDM